MDRRRVNGPEGTYAPFHKSQTSKGAIVKPPVFESRTISTDDRSNAESRSFEANRTTFMKCGMVSNANGSAYIEAGNTKIMASVYGPMAQARSEGYKEKGSLNVDFKFATFSCQNERRGFLKVSFNL